MVSGGPVATVFALGLVEAGPVAILTTSASTAYGTNAGVALIAAVIVIIPGVPLLSTALNANVLATVLLPVMGGTITRFTNVTGIAIISLVALCGTAQGVDSFLLTIDLIPARPMSAANAGLWARRPALHGLGGPVTG